MRLYRYTTDLWGLSLACVLVYDAHMSCLDGTPPSSSSSHSSLTTQQAIQRTRQRIQRRDGRSSSQRHHHLLPQTPVRATMEDDMKTAAGAAKDDGSRDEAQKTKRA